MLTTQPAVSRFRVVPMGQLRMDKLRALLHDNGRFDAVVAFRPTGWCNTRSTGAAGRVVRTGKVTLHEVPYSEHSSFEELRTCLRDLQPLKVVPTVNAGSKEKVRALLQALS